MDVMKKQVADMADNLTVAPWGHLIVCEDNYSSDIRNHLKGVTPDGQVYAIGRNVFAGNSEFAGAVFSPDGEVQNRIIHTQATFTQSQLLEAANFLNSHYSGLTMEAVRERLKNEVDALRGEIADLMKAAVDIGAESDAAQDEVVVSGERNLLSVTEFSSDMGNLRRMFDLFEQKTQLIRLLDVSAQADGVRIYIGGESQVVPFEDLSVVTAPYEVDGQVVGTLGVIGPQRMPYERMIQIVDVTSKLVSNALSHK